MNETDEMAVVSKTQNYLSEDSSTVFRIAWYQIASKPNVLLDEYSEAESQLFQGYAKFSLHIGGEKAFASITVDGKLSSVELQAQGNDEVALKIFLDQLMDELFASISWLQKMWTWMLRWS